MENVTTEVDSMQGSPPTAMGPQNYDVTVKVEEPEPKVFYVSVRPERVQLSGHPGNTVTWTLTGNTGASFKTKDDIKFNESGGRRLQTKMGNSPNTIVAQVVGQEVNQTIYTYMLTVHFDSVGVALRIDPEVDNPPPPPT